MPHGPAFRPRRGPSARGLDRPPVAALATPSVPFAPAGDRLRSRRLVVPDLPERTIARRSIRWVRWVRCDGGGLRLGQTRPVALSPRPGPTPLTSPSRPARCHPDTEPRTPAPSRGTNTRSRAQQPDTRGRADCSTPPSSPGRRRPSSGTRSGNPGLATSRDRGVESFAWPNRPLRDEDSRGYPGGVPGGVRPPGRLSSIPDPRTPKRCRPRGGKALGPDAAGLRSADRTPHGTGLESRPSWSRLRSRARVCHSTRAGQGTAWGSEAREPVEPVEPAEPVPAATHGRQSWPRAD